MDEMVELKLKAMGYDKIPDELRNLLNEWKRRQDAVQPHALTLDAIVACTFLYQLVSKKKG